MSASTHTLSLTRPVGWLGGLVVLVLAATAIARWQGWQDRVSDAPVQWERSLRFEDTPQGEVQVSDADSGQVVALFAGEQGFLRGTLRALVRERRRQSANEATPFVLRGHADARLVLLDPSTGQRIDLDSFGPSNKAVFARLQPTAPLSPSLHGTVSQGVKP
jgi:putative photosynthetic complex assembly protein